MKVNKSEVFSVLRAAKPGLARKEFLAEAVRFIFTGTDVATFNDEICVIVPFETDFQCSVDGEELYKILEGINEEEIELSLKKDKLLINSKHTKAGLSTIIVESERVIDRIEIIQKRVNKKGFWKRLPVDFIEGVSLCMFSTSKNAAKKAYTCVAIKGDTVYSTDESRISRFTMSSAIDEELLIPNASAFDLVNYKINRYGTGEGWIHFRTEDDAVFSCTTLNGDFPYIINRFFYDREDAFDVPVQLQEIMKNAIVMTSSESAISQSVQITIKKGIISCRSEKEKGWLVKSIDFEDYDDKEIEFRVNPIFFSQILNQATKMFLVIGEEFPDKAMFSRNKFQHGIALVDLREDK